MDDLSAANLLELVAGKNRSSVVAAILQNGDILDEAYTDAFDSAGSAANELDTYLNSIEGRITLFNTAVQTMWTNFLDDDVIKWFVDLGTWLVKAADDVGLLRIAFVGLMGVMTVKNTDKFDIVGWFGKLAESTKKISDIKTNGIAETVKVIASLPDMLSAVQGVEISMDGIDDLAVKLDGATAAAATGQEALQKYASGLGDSDKALKAYIASVDDGQYSMAGFNKFCDAHNAQLQTTSVKTKLAAAGHAALNAAITMGISLLVSYVLPKVINFLDDLILTAEEAAEAAKELTDAYKTAKKEFEDDIELLTISSDSESYETLLDEFKELTMGVNKYGENISLTADEYSRYKEICEAIVGIQPSIAKGYDSATEAIGRNAGILEKVIGLKKEEARLNAAEFVSYGLYSDNGNFETLATNAIESRKKAAENAYLMAMGSKEKTGLIMDTGLVNTLYGLYGGYDYDYDAGEFITDRPFDSDGDRLATNLMRIIGYSPKEIGKVLQTYYNESGNFELDRWALDYLDEIVENKTLIAEDAKRMGLEGTDEWISTMYAEADAYESASNNLKAAADNMIDVYLQIPYALEDYDALSSGEQSLLNAWIQNDDMFKIDEETTEEDILKAKQTIIDMVRLLANEDYFTEIDGKKVSADLILDSIFNLDPSELDYAQYKEDMQTLVDHLWNAIGGENNEFGIKDKQQLMVMFGVEFVPEEDEQALIDDIVRITGMAPEEAQKWIDEQPAIVITRMLEYDYDEIGNTEGYDVDDLAEMAVPNYNYIEPRTVKTYTALSEEASNYNDILAQTNELTGYNVEVTQEYKDSLKELGITDEELNECFDENNGLIVTNTRKLRELVAEKEKALTTDVKMAKAQSQLDYYELVKELDATLDGVTSLDDETKDLTDSILEQIDIVRKAINNYQRLEDSLLGVTNGFEKFHEAQEIDSQNTYGDDYVDMAQTMYDAFYVSGEVGTEANWAAIEALVPDWVYEGLETDGERMRAIYEYFNKEILPTLTLEDGQLSLGFENVEDFIEHGLASGVFEGDLSNFSLVEGLDLEEAAELMGMTTTQAYAFFATLDDYTTGDGMSFLAQLDDSFSGNIMKTTDEMQRLNEEKLALLSGGEDGIISPEEQARIDEINNVDLPACEENLRKIGETAYQTWDEFKHNEIALAALGEVENKAQKVSDVFSKEFIAEFGLNGDDTIQEAYDDLLLIQSGIENIDATSAAAAIDVIDEEIAKLEERKRRINEDTTMTPEIKAAETAELDAQIEAYKSDKVEIATEFGIELTEEEEKDLEEQLEAIKEFEIGNKSFIVTDDGTIKQTIEALDELNKVEIDDKTFTTTNVIEEKHTNGGILGWITGTDTYKKATGYPVRVDGTAHAEGTAFKTGSWGAPKTEEALVGELGPELLVRDGKWTTIGDEGAEFEHIEKGDIIFNHKQTEELLSNGHVTGRGKAYAEGTAYNDVTGVFKPQEEKSEPIKYTTVFDEMSDYNDILAETNELTVDNIEVTEEYREALEKLGFTEDELNTYFDDENKLLVKNVKGLKMLVASKKKEKVATVQEVKARNQLDYVASIKEIGKLVDVMEGASQTQEGISKATLEASDVLHSHVDALEQTIQGYALLELKMSDAAAAYDDFEIAQQQDAELSWGGTMIDMLEAIDEGFRTGQVGSEAFQAAVAALVPDWVYKDLDTVEEQMHAIHDYIDSNPIFADWFTVDDNGNFSIEFQNMQAFVQDGIDGVTEFGAVFEGTVDNFTLAEGVDSLEEFAKRMGVTESVALAMLGELEKYDARWGNVITDLTTSPLDREILNATEALEDAYTAQEEFIRNGGDLNSEEYKQLVQDVEDAEAALDSATEAAGDYASTYSQAEAVLKGVDGQMTFTQETADALARSLGLVNENGECTITIDDNGKLLLTESQAARLQQILQVLGEEPSIIDVQLAYDTADAQIQKLEKILDDGVVDEAEATFLVELDIDPESDNLAQEIQNEIDELETTKTVINLTYGITQTSEGQDSGIEQLSTWETNGVTIPIHVDITSYQEEAATINESTLDNKEVAFTADATEANEEIDSVDNNQINDKNVKINVDNTSALTNISTVQTALNNLKDKEINIKVKVSGGNPINVGGSVDVDGTAHASGTAFKSGTWGAEQNETALVGELGPELLVRNGRWTTVGENGAEFTDVRKGDIIFNHRQTEELLSKGYVTGRGKAFAEGNAYGYGLFGDYITDKGSTFKNGSDKTWSKTADKVSQAAKDIGSSAEDAADEFREVFDWIEVRLEEINKEISLKGAQLENAVGFTKQNAIIDDMIELNQKLYTNLTAGASKYYSYARNLLAKVPAEYRKAAQDGTIAIESFTGKVGEDTLEAIKEYREWVQKGDDATQQAEETLKEISTLAKQAIDNIAAQYDNKASLRDSKIEQYEAYNEYIETDQGFSSEKVYKAIIDQNNKKIKDNQNKRDDMQAELDEKVKSGEIKKYSQDWYDAVNDIAAVDAEIIQLQTDNENLQDDINELHWDKFDSLLTRIDAITEETEGLLKLLENEDAFDESGNWTDEGITSLGLYAQQMEAAEFKAKQFEEEIDYLNKNWKKLGYTEQEYIEKLAELKEGQQDAIDAYHDSKKAIVDLNKERVEAIKEGIQKEIEAYDELIEKKKEELSAEKDLYDFQKNVKNQQKDIADIERQLAALSGDNSASARAKRAQLEAELAEAKESLEDTYYDRSISKQQEALDEEQENFHDAKEKEIEGWEKYLEDVEKVVADSLTTVQANTETVYSTLQEMGNEYGLSISESITTPWKNGETAIQSFSEKFGLAMSSTVEELKELETVFNETIKDIEQSGKTAVETVNESHSNYTGASKEEATSDKGSGGSSGGSKDSGNSSGETYPYGKASATSGNIKQGAKGKDVKAIQYALNQLGYGNSGTKSVDGIFGSGTTKAVKSFQKSMGISADGIVGVKTRQKFKAKGYAVGTTGVDEDQWAWIDEMGLEEIVLHAQDGKLTYLSKGSAVLPHDISENLMKLGQLDPSLILEQNKPSVGLGSNIINNTMQINVDASVGTLLHVDEFNGDDPAEVVKIVNKALEQHTKNLNSALRKYTR